ncbi:MAG: carbohydrate binding family 9 domain-containing protein [Proteobacteria bacterium]|nr:carbohydrate binding family 9 domain-containing protein [Pseudomonadota bacterium]
MWKIAALVFSSLLISSPLVLAATKPVGRLQAHKTTKPPSIDGNLSDLEWRNATSVSGFTQTFPQPGTPASLKTEVWILYDDDALYIATHCHDSNPKEIVARMTRRDREIESDWFEIAIDGRMDKRTGFFFKVNAAGVQQDGMIYDENSSDTDWDGVWEAKTGIVEDGWIVEMRIPLRLLRFPSSEKVSFGINFERRISRLNEETQWQYIPPDLRIVLISAKFT